MPPRILFSDEQRADMVRRYESGEPPRIIANDYGISRATLYDNLHAWGVTLLSDRAARRSPAPVQPGSSEAEEPASDAASETPSGLIDHSDEPVTPGASAPLLRRRLEIATERGIAMVEAMLTNLRGARAGLADAERAARTLASLSRTLRQLSTVDEPEAAATDDDVPRDLDELRRVLAARLDRVAGEMGNRGDHPGDDAA